MLVGPVFTREWLTAARRQRLYFARAGYVAALLVLVCTAWLLVAGTQFIRNLGDMARFGSMLFGILAPLQLALATFFAALWSASAVAQEKDRRTLELLLLTNLSNSELVLGKLFASLLQVFTLLAVAVPLFMWCALFGGVSFSGIARAFAVTVSTVLVAGSIGSTLAFWREKTFQTLSLVVLALVVWLALGEALAAGALGETIWGVSSSQLAVMSSPWQAIREGTRPLIDSVGSTLLGDPIRVYVLLAISLSIVLNAVAIGRVRVWNPTREVRARMSEADAESIWGMTEETARERQTTRSVHAAPGPTRQVWDNPILWREVATWAYGRRVLAVRVVYIALVVLAGYALAQVLHSPAGLSLGSAMFILAPLFVLSLALINAQAVTSLTSERDARAIDLLLASDLTAKEFVFGKLAGVIYNTKEMVILPLLLCVYLWFASALGGENLIYVVSGALVIDAFVAMVGLHAGMNYANSRAAIGISLGTVFFLFVGIATCMQMMVAFGGSFSWQIQPFLAFMLGGSAGLYAALGSRNPSVAIGVASALCPIATFYALTSLLLQYTLSVFLVIAGMYGFATAALLIPAIFEFDVATGRTTGAEE